MSKSFDGKNGFDQLKSSNDTALFVLIDFGIFKADNRCFIKFKIFIK